MNQIVGSATALVLALVLWGLGKRPQKTQKELLGHYQTNQTSLIHLRLADQLEGQSDSDSMIVTFDNSHKWAEPISTPDQIILLKELKNMMKGGPDEKLKAIKISNLWGNKSTLPILRIGLKDADSQVRKEAAAAIQKYKGMQCLQSSHTSDTARPPRNVALMR